MPPYEFVGMRRFLDRACAGHATAPFLHWHGREWSYAELGAVTDGAAAEFSRLGLARGDRIALLFPNGPEALFLWLAAAKLGVVACPLHPELAPAEVARMLAHLEPRALAWDARLEERLSASEHGPDRVAIRLRFGAPVREGLPATASVEELLAARTPLTGVEAPRADDVLDILTTSGTTGRPKGVMQSHRTAVITGEAFVHWLGLGASDRMFTCLPLAHINARFYSTMGALAAGACLVLEERFSASRFWRWIADARATQFNAIGAMLQILARAEAAPEERSHSVRVAYAAPALGRAAHASFEERFGLRLVIGYGLSESTFGFIQPLAGPRDLDAMGTVRRHPHPDLRNAVRFVVEDGAAPGGRRDAAPGEAGEVWLQNAALFSGYFRDPAGTDAALADGWLRTGDLARASAAGEVTFVGRKKHIIRRRGENIAPAEIEAALEAHPAVREVAVIGVPAELGEEDVRAYVVLAIDARTDATELAAHCARQLAAFKVPTQWRFVDLLPRTPTQRVAYHMLPRDPEPGAPPHESVDGAPPH